MKIKPGKPRTERIVMKTSAGKDPRPEVQKWWLAKDEAQLASQLCSSAAFLKTTQTYRLRQLAVDVRLYAGLSVYSYAGSNVSRLDQTKSLPDDRPTFNLIQSCTDTLVSRLTQSRPSPVFLTDNGDYRERHRAQQLNQFILGEFNQTKAYEKAPKQLRDGIVMGTGALKVFRTEDDKVGVDRTMITDLYTDANDSINGEPQQLYQLKLMDRDRLITANPKHKKTIMDAGNAYPDNMADNGRSASDQVMVVEGWKLPSGPGKKDGRHTIACVNGVIFDEPHYDKQKFPFVWLNYSDPFLGFFGQGLATQLFGTQLTLNRVLYTIARAITLVGVPRVFQEQNSKVMKTANNNEIGVIVTYSGTKPSYEVAPCNAPELYAERDKLIQYGYQQCGLSMMQATSQKPAGLNSGEAQRVYDDISTDRFALLSRKYDNVFIDLAYLITDTAMDIAKENGKYQTVYPNKDGTKEIDLPKMKLDDPFVIQCFNTSSLPRDPAGRTAKITEWVQAGMITLKEGRRLMHFPDLEQNEKLSNASEERIFKVLDGIVEDGKWTPPDAFMDLLLAEELTVQYYNLYVAAKLEEARAQMLRDFHTTIQALKAQAAPPPVPGPLPTANPMPNAQSALIPNTNAPQAA